MPSDAFADLWNTGSPASATANSSKAQPLASQLIPTPPLNGRSQKSSKLDTFSLLAMTSSSQTGSRSITPSFSSSSAKPNAQTASTSDAFSSLLSASFLSSSQTGEDGASLSLADKQKRSLHEQRLGGGSASTADSTMGLWNGLDMLGNAGAPASVVSNVHPGTPAPPEDSRAFDFDFDTKGMTSTAFPSMNESISLKASHEDVYDITSEILSRPTETYSSPGSESFSFHPFERFTSTTLPLQSSDSDRDPCAPDGNPGDLKIGDREYGNEDDRHDEVDEILGVSGSRNVRSLKSDYERPSQSSVLRSKTSASPPPHIIGQIVEMGFSPHLAKLALAATDTGVDVNQAIENLVNGVSDDNGSSSSQILTSESSTQRSHPRVSRHPSDTKSSGSSAYQSRPQTQSPSNVSTGDLQEKADKLLAQASEIGLSVFSRAGALWKEGKARAQKVYDEQIVAGTSNPTSGSSTRTSAQNSGRRKTANGTGDVAQNLGRPKWMSENRNFNNEVETEESHTSPSNGSNRFRDEDILNTGPSALKRQTLSEAETPVNLFGDEDKAYVSPARRQRGTGIARQETFSGHLHREHEVQTTPSQAASPRNLVRASHAAISTSVSHKAKGTELYKLGRYAEAAAAYSSALASLPNGHLCRVPLYNNRAIARLKTGDHAGAAEDCSAALVIIGKNDVKEYQPTRAREGEDETTGAGIDLGDGWVKAVRRRAEAFESREKWSEALKDWEILAGCSWAAVQMRNEAVAGIRRCKKGIIAIDGLSTTSNAVTPDLTLLASPSIVSASTVPPAFSTSNHKLKLKPIALSNAANASIAAAVRAAKAASKAEEDEVLARHELKDSVDARLLAWKGGKETNLRALIASLDAVLWPELEWQKVGMHELVTERQLKVRYTRAIAKLHPDKLNTSNTTLEQRMIANGVFGTLNDAWVSHKG